MQAHVNLIRLYAQLGQPDKAEEHYRSALAVDPNLAELHHNYGVLLTGQGRSAEATEAFRKAVALNPAHAEAQSNLAYLLMTSGKLDEAALHYRAAIESRPQHRAAHFNLARILVRQGSLREAIEHLEQTLLPEDDGDAPLHVRARRGLGAGREPRGGPQVHAGGAVEGDDARPDRAAGLDRQGPAHAGAGNEPAVRLARPMMSPFLLFAALSARERSPGRHPRRPRSPPSPTSPRRPESGSST